MKFWAKISFVVIVLAAALAAYFLVLKPLSVRAPTPEQSSEQSTTAPPANNPQTSSSAVNAPQQPAPTAALPPAEQNIITISYADQGFSPVSLSIKKGDAAKFVNQSSRPLWVGSDPHPAHTGYPETGGCINSAFDSCRVIQPGDSWSFTFTISGAWGYHNHLNPGEKGTVIVK